MSESADTLAQEYGGPLPPGLAALTTEQRQLLADAIAAARVRQAEALEAATENGLGFVPKLLRPAIKKVLFR
ncbi:hypothetical protein F0U44_04760 [Nocardioides humilatus]|uniref:Uncharacterized protein n=1 Tax=Nocardioides humilatus TaxID=2607660 RepID=A0A5B1LLF5_9ACTN|nr:hypothetical protein [Nocardioides humilatus]KAA1421595.1 hypothetical protein F0U44_04760 [Nocardioides humilatus]